jgi:ribonuclease HI
VGGHQYPPRSWGLRTLTKNEVEAYALFAGINLVVSKHIKNIIICDESMLVIRAMNHRNIIGGNVFKGVMSRILDTLQKFDNTTLYHIKCDLNLEADRQANIGSRINKGYMLIQGELRLHHLP